MNWMRLSGEVGVLVVPESELKEAMFYQKLEDGKVKCRLCFHYCVISEGRTGICGVRVNRGGTLHTLVYGKSIDEHVDPIEKKPLFHFYPGSKIFSLATAGCNFRCLHCQNFSISQVPREQGAIIGHDLPPEMVVKMAKEAGCQSIAYTYTEPTIFFEYAYDTAVLAHEQGLKNVFVTNGYIDPEALRTIRPYLDAANVDLKAFSEEFYRKVCGAHLQPVLDSLKLYKELGIWLEVTTLIIPSYNDSEGELRQIAEFVRSLGEDTPWHVTQFYPTHKLLSQPRTPIETLRQARQIGQDVGLRYVYEGNVPGEGGENTYCYNCQELLVERYGYMILANRIKDSKCYNCGVEINGVGL
jgi:pyruvate formate lyase activating enzyme